MNYAVSEVLSSPVLFTFLLFAILAFMPFLPGIIELKRPKDALPLFIKMDYMKDPRYFERSFKSLLNKAMENEGPEPGIKNVRLSKNEEVEVADSKTIADGESVDHILYVRGNFKSGNEAYLRKEIYAGGVAELGVKNIVRAVACDGNVTVSEGSKIVRWIGAEGDMKVAENCSLGVLCASSGKLEINRKCTFKALYGRPVVTYDVQNGFISKEIPPGETEKKNSRTVPDGLKTIGDIALYSSEEELIISPRSLIERDIIAKKNLVLKNGCTVSASIKAYGNIFIGEGTTVDGNIFAEGEIIVGRNCTVTGNIFSQSVIRFAENVRAGKKGAVKSVIGKKGIELTSNNVIFGYVLTEGTGRII
ncbi:MAG: hypothetical protein JW957_02970 [Candidatus Omnitrophica bacterium]|nr:hypothetical protein [Candidatus Omnitrophota bacterium]